MKIIKVISEQTYTGKDGKEYHYKNFLLELDNGRMIQIKPSFTKDYNTLDAVATLIDNRKK